LAVIRHASSQKFPAIALLVFGCLARAPSKECGRWLLTKLGLAQFTARLLWRLDGDWYRAFNIFDIHTAPQTIC